MHAARHLSFAASLLVVAAFSSTACNAELFLDDCGPEPDAGGCLDACGRPSGAALVCEGGQWQCPVPPPVFTCDSCPTEEPTDCIDECGDSLPARCIDGAWECIDPGLPVCGPVYPEGARWNASLGSNALEEASRVLIDDDDFVYVAARFQQSLFFDGDDGGFTSSGGYDVAVTRYDASGNRQWTAQFGGAGDDFAQGLAFHPDGTLLMLMSSSAQPGEQNGPATLMKLSKENGVLLTEEPLGFDIESGQETRLAIQPGNGDIVVAGSVSGPVSVAGAPALAPVSTDTDLFVAKFNESMVPLWGRRFGGTGADALHGVDIDASGRVFLAGASNSPSLSFDDLTVDLTDGFDGFVAALEPSAGEALWVGRLASPSDASFDDVKAFGDGGVVITGAFSGGAEVGGTTVEAPDDAVRYGTIARFDGDGSLVFANRLDGITPALGLASYWKAERLAFGGLLVFGSPLGGAFGTSDITVLRFNQFGSLLQTQRFGDAQHDVVLDVDGNGNQVAAVGIFDGALGLGLGPMPSLSEGTGFVAAFLGRVPQQ